MRSYLIPDSAPSMEEFKSSDVNITKIVENCEKLTRDQWKKAIQPGDVLIPYPKMKKVWKHYQLIGKLNQLIQGSSFTSCKMVGKDAREIIGYGAVLNTLGITKVSLDTFLNDHEISIILRHRSATKEKMTKVVDKMYEYKKHDQPYDIWNLVTSTIHHWLGTSDVKEEDEKFMKDVKHALICSTIIYKCYKEAKLEIDHPSTIGAAWLWPKDILLSPSMEVVGGYFSKDAKITKKED